MRVTELKNSGLPLYMDEKNYVMSLSALLKFDTFGRKNTGEMKGLLLNETKIDLQEPFYDVYRGISFPEDEGIFRKNNFRYDITIIMPGLVNGECKKTSGHYHGWNKKRTNTYAEVYEVIKGTAMYILQRANNFETEPHKIKINDLIIATVNEGETIIVPPNYGHCSINIGEGPMVFSNLAYVPCPIHYEAVKHYHGMAYYILKEKNEIKLQLNEKYHDVSKPKFATVKANKRLGIEFGVPIYDSYRKNPEAFHFLAEPDDYVEEIMDMLCF